MRPIGDRCSGLPPGTRKNTGFESVDEGSKETSLLPTTDQGSRANPRTPAAPIWPDREEIHLSVPTGFPRWYVIRVGISPILRGSLPEPINVEKPAGYS